ncbi:MAG: DUF5067 domain-containing protein [Lachnospiraceae bacterium]
MKCPICGRELRIQEERVRTNELGEPVYEEFGVCQKCKKKWNLDKARREKIRASYTKPSQATPESENSEPEEIFEDWKEQKEIPPQKNKLAVGVLIALAVFFIVGAIFVWKYANQSAPKVNQETQVSTDDTGDIHLKTNNFMVKYSSHEVGTDAKGNQCLFVYYEFANTGKEKLVPRAALLVQATQNDTECAEAVITDSKEEIDNYVKEVEPGKTLKVGQAFVIGDRTDVILKLSAMTSMNQKSDEQTISLQ